MSGFFWIIFAWIILALFWFYSANEISFWKARNPALILNQVPFGVLRIHLEALIWILAPEFSREWPQRNWASAQTWLGISMSKLRFLGARLSGGWDAARGRRPKRGPPTSGAKATVRTTIFQVKAPCHYLIKENVEGSKFVHITLLDTHLDGQYLRFCDFSGKQKTGWSLDFVFTLIVMIM